MKYFKKIEGERLYLSPINPEDYEICTKWLNDETMTKNTSQVRHTIGLAKEKAFLEKMAEEGNDFAVVLKENDEFIGCCGFHNINAISRNCEIGLFIGDEENRGKGYGGEILKLLISYGFEILNMHNIMLKVFSFNERAIKCYEKAGFKKIGARRNAYYYRGKYYDDVFMDLLAEEYWDNMPVKG